MPQTEQLQCRQMIVFLTTKFPRESFIYILQINLKHHHLMVYLIFQSFDKQIAGAF